ncbi:hypothetical protein LPJ57_007558, partial [Coemansia sp. RSA 486]
MLTITYPPPPLSPSEAVVQYVCFLRDIFGETEYVPVLSTLEILIFIVFFIGLLKMAFIAYKAVAAIVRLILGLFLSITKAAVCVVIKFFGIFALVGSIFVDSAYFVVGSVVSAAKAVVSAAVASAALVIAQLVWIAAARMAGPTVHSLVSAVPGTVTIVDSACIWSVQLPRGTGIGFGFARLVVPGTLCFADFAGVIAAGGVVSCLSPGSAAAAAINLGLDSVAPVTLTVERQIQRLGFAAAARLAEVADAGIVLDAVVVAPAVLTVERLAPRRSPVVAINHSLALLTASAPAAVERRALMVGKVATESLLAMLVAPARSQVAYSAVLKVTQVARKPVKIQAAVLGTAAVAPRALFVEHPAFVAAMGLVDPFAIEMPLTFKSVVDSAPVVLVLFGPAKPSA